MGWLRPAFRSSWNYLGSVAYLVALASDVSSSKSKVSHKKQESKVLLRIPRRRFQGSGGDSVGHAEREAPRKLQSSANQEATLKFRKQTTTRGNQNLRA